MGKYWHCSNRAKKSTILEIKCTCSLLHKMHRCEECNITFKLETGLTRHYKLHLENIKTHCRKCNNFFYGPTAYRAHPCFVRGAEERRRRKALQETKDQPKLAQIAPSYTSQFEDQPKLTQNVPSYMSQFPPSRQIVQAPVLPAIIVHPSPPLRFIASRNTNHQHTKIIDNVSSQIVSPPIKPKTFDDYLCEAVFL